MQKLREDLEQNLELIQGRRYLTAGRHQFRSLWLRDFCFSSKALQLTGHEQVVKDQLDLFLQHLHPELNLVPRTMDSIPAQWRVVRQVLSAIWPWFRKPLPMTAKLKPEYWGEHKTPAFDSNILLVTAALTSVSDEAWLEQRKPLLEKVLSYYPLTEKTEFLSQPPYSDWQDGVCREGLTFLTHFYWWRMTILWQKRWPEKGLDEEQLWERIHDKFFDIKSGLYFSLNRKNSPISSDGNLLLIDFLLDLGRKDEAKKLYQSLKKHPLWVKNKIPGFVTWPDYPQKDKSWTTRFVGLSHYHDSLSWSWLMGLSLKVSRRMQDAEEVRRMEEPLTKLIQAGVQEIYDVDQQTLKPWSSWWLKAESPFAWGTALLIEGFWK